MMYWCSLGNEEKWTILYNADKSDFIMTCVSHASNTSEVNPVDPNNGIILGHAYSLLECYELIQDPFSGKYRVLNNFEQNDSNLNIQKIIKFRNPWGKTEWKGLWSDSDPIWSDELKKQLKFQIKEDGVFFMSYDDFSKNFSTFQICYYHDNYNLTSWKLTTQSKVRRIFKFTIPSDQRNTGYFYVSLHQAIKRMFKPSQNYKDSTIGFTVSRKNENSEEMTYLGAKLDHDPAPFVKIKTKPGVYYITVFTNWKSFTNEIN